MKNRPLCSICLIISVFVCISVCLGGECFLKELKPSQAEIHFQTGESVHLVGRVYDRTEKENYQILYLKQISIIYHQQSLKESRIIIYDENKSKILIGDVLEVTGDVRFFEGAKNPGNFDQRQYYQRKNIHEEVWAKSIVRKDSNIRTKYEYVKERLYCFRKLWKDRLYESVGEKAAKTLSAILLGEKSQMDEELRDLYQVNGIGHVLAISGLHLSFIGAGIYQLFRRTSGSYLLGGAAGILFLSLYVLMVGLSVSVVRAFIMFLFRVGADMTGRNYDCVTALSFAAMCVLLWRPLSIYDGGFWLSFGAVAALIFISPLFRELPFQGFWASVSVTVLLLPVLLVQFFEFPLYSVFLNVIVIPLLSLLFVLIMAGSVIGYIWNQAGACMMKGAEWILKCYDWMCQTVLLAPGARIVTGKPEWWQVMLYYLCLLGALIVYRYLIKKKRKRKSLPVLIGVAGLLVLFTPFGRFGTLKVTVMDVGQGDSIFLRGPYGRTYLIDGGSSDIKHVGKYRIEPFLKSQGVKTLDYVFVSHGDSDHTNGISEMLERQKVGIEIKTLVFPVESAWDESLKTLARKAMKNGTECVQIMPGQMVKEGKLSLACILPEEGKAYESDNEASMVLRLSYQGFDLLFAGDVEGVGEEKLTELINGQKKRYEVLKAAHHGSKSSTGEEFLQTVQPDCTIISAGKNNRYGHPHKETIDRLKKVGSKVYSTIDCGAVTVIVKRDGNYCIRRYIS